MSGIRALSGRSCSGPCVDGSPLARVFWSMLSAGWSGHVFGLIVAALSCAAGRNGGINDLPHQGCPAVKLEFRLRGTLGFGGQLITKPG